MTCDVDLTLFDIKTRQRVTLTWATLILSISCFLKSFSFSFLIHEQARNRQTDGHTGCETKTSCEWVPHNQQLSVLNSNCWKAPYDVVAIVAHTSNSSGATLVCRRQTGRTSTTKQLKPCSAQWSLPWWINSTLGVSTNVGDDRFTRVLFSVKTIWAWDRVLIVSIQK